MSVEGIGPIRVEVEYPRVGEKDMEININFFTQEGEGRWNWIDNLMFMIPKEEVVQKLKDGEEQVAIARNEQYSWINMVLADYYPSDEQASWKILRDLCQRCYSELRNIAVLDACLAIKHEPTCLQGGEAILFS